MNRIFPPAPGLYEDIPTELYFSWKAASQSELCTLRDGTPAHLFARWEGEDKDTPAKILGRAIHTATLQPDLFEGQYARGPEGDWRTKEAKAQLNIIRSGLPQGTVLKPEQYDKIRRIREAVRNHPIARGVLDGEAERSAVWIDPKTKLSCKARFDDISRSTGCVVDLKTTMSAHPDVFPRCIYNYGYYIQAAHYVHGAHLCGLDVENFVIVAVEKDPPYAVCVYRVRDDALQAGRDEREALLDVYAGCAKANHWPSYPERVQDVTLNPWDFRKVDQRIMAKTEGAE